MKYDILLIRPNWPKSGIGLPLGLQYISSYLKKNGFSVLVKDLMYDNITEEIWSSIKNGDIPVVGITMLSRLRSSGYNLVTQVKMKNPNTTVIVGGVHVLGLSDLLVRKLDIDIVVEGEGEETMLELMQNLRDGVGNLKDVHGVTSRDYGIHPYRPLIQDLDKLPFPDYTDVDLSFFRPPIMSLKPNFEINSVRLGCAKYTNMITSRGCIGRCLFCNAWKHWGGKVRFRSASNVYEELSMLNGKYGINLVEFNDDSFAQDRDMTMNLCQKIIDDDLKVAWFSAIRPDVVDKELLQYMHEAGCFMLAYGIESGSEKILKNIGKQTNKDTIRNAVELTKQVGIKAYALLMVGNKGETESTIQETINFISEIKPDLHSEIGKVWVYPSTPYEKMMGIDRNFWLTGGDEMPFFYDGFNDDMLNEWCRRISEIPKPWLIGGD